MVAVKAVGCPRMVGLLAAALSPAIASAMVATVWVDAALIAFAAVSVAV
jgi:hypothetical protein